MHKGIRRNRLSAVFVAAAAIAANTLFGAPSVAAPSNDAHSVSATAGAAKVVAALDTEFQRAVKNNDAATIDRILADNFVLVTGRGQAQHKAEQLREARDRSATYEHQEDTNRTVRVWGNIAVVTALLWAKGSESGKPFEVKLWFSDVYVRTPKGWRYVFGQASLPLPAAR